MPETSGYQKLGQLLGGGAGQVREQAYQEGKYRTAQTEDALANARKHQLESTTLAAQDQQIEGMKTAAAEKGDPLGIMVAEAVRAGGGNAQQIMEAQLRGQEYGNRDILGDPDALVGDQFAASQGVQGKRLPRHVPVGTYGTEDLLDPEGQLIASPGGGTTASKNYLFNQTLTPEEQNNFSPFVRADQVVNAGGVPTVRRATTGDASEIVPAAQVASNAGDIAQAKRTGQEVAAQKADFPQALFTLDQSKLSIKAQNDLAAELDADEKLWQTVGPTQLISKIPGTEGAYIRAKRDTLLNKVMLATLLNLRAMSKTGGAVGNVSDREGDTMRGAIAALQSPDIMAGDFRKELQRLIAYNAELEKNLDAAFSATYSAEGNPVLSQGARGSAAAGGGGGGGEPTIEELILDNGDGEMDEAGNIVRADGSGWTLETDAAGNKAWVSPDRTGYEEVAQ